MKLQIIFLAQIFPHRKVNKIIDHFDESGGIRSIATCGKGNWKRKKSLIADMK